MPTYEFLDLNTGKTIELRKSIEDRDKVPANLKRVTAPQRLTVFGTSSDKIEPNTVFSSVPKAFKEYENTSGLSTKQIEAKVGFSRDHVRRVFNFVVLAVALLAAGCATSNKPPAKPANPETGLHFGPEQPITKFKTGSIDITPGYNFLVNDTVTAAKLNSAAAGSIKTSFIHGQTFYAPGPADELVFYAASIGNVLRRSSLSVSFLSNTNLIVGQTPSSTPGTNWHLLMLDGTATQFFQVSAYDLLTTALTNPVVLTLMTNVVNGTPGTNLTAQTTLNPGDSFRLFDSSNNAVKQVLYSTLFKTFTSTPVALTNLGTNVGSTGINVAHGLSGTPTRVRAVLVCTNDDSLSTFANGDEIDGNALLDFTSQLPVFNFGANATNVFAKGGFSAQFALRSKTSGIVSRIGLTNFLVKIIANQ